MLEDDESYVDDTTAAVMGESPVGHAEPAPIQKFRATAVGSVLAAGLLGLREALEPPKDEPAIIVDWSGAPPFSEPIVLRLDPDHPEDSIVMVRPWLRNPPA